MILAPIEMPAGSRGPIAYERILRHAAGSIPSDPAIERQDVMLLDTPSPFVPGYVLLYRAAQGQRIPLSLRNLASSTGPVEIYRCDARTLVVRPEGGYIQAWDRIVRGEGFPMQPGQRVDLPRLLAEVKALTPDGRPAAAMFRFATDLEDPSLRWFRWDRAGAGYVVFAPPAIGETMHIR